MPVYYMRDNSNPKRAPFQVGDGFLARHKDDPRFSIVSIDKKPQELVNVEPVKKKPVQDRVAVDPEHYNSMSASKAKAFVSKIKDGETLQGVLTLENLRDKPRKTVILAIQRQGVTLATD